MIRNWLSFMLRRLPIPLTYGDDPEITRVRSDADTYSSYLRGSSELFLFKNIVTKDLK